ncbi:thymus-specific serine protease-like [Bacillus rossius redtenbacheri]|uniref:thymus-specific serine protease-like n=1 Tax=Bacillus rossius redtenbacheri TaxID=93214 RepID=UPI002FDCCC62
MVALATLVILACVILEQLWLDEAGTFERILAAASPTTRQSAIQETWITQRLDHFNPADTRIWEQRYFQNLEHLREGGPLFVFVGGEEPTSTAWLQDGQMMALARTYGAAAFLLEHRFYGANRPTEDVSTESLAYLTTEQALADLALFVAALRGRHGGGGAAPRVVLFGRSYAASLAAWARLKYPHLVAGAVASSAPLLAKADFREFLEGVAVVLGDESPDCVAHIRAATAEMKRLLTADGGPQELTQLFSLCRPLNASRSHDVAKLFGSMAALVATAVTDNAALADGRDSVASACNLLVNASFGATPLRRYAGVMGRQLRLSSSRCLLVDEDAVVARYRNTSWGSRQVASGDRQWLYQTCTQFGFYQTSESVLQPFGVGMFPLEHSLHLCSAVFGERFTKDLLEEGIARTNLLYGAVTPEVSNVVFLYGSMDPWSYLGAQGSRSQDTYTIDIEGAAHAADMSAASAADSPDLAQARLAVEDIVGDWLARDAEEPWLQPADMVVDVEFDNDTDTS